MTGHRGPAAAPTSRLVGSLAVWRPQERRRARQDGPLGPLAHLPSPRACGHGRYPPGCPPRLAAAALILPRPWCLAAIPGMASCQRGLSSAREPASLAGRLPARVWRDPLSGGATTGIRGHGLRPRMAVGAQMRFRPFAVTRSGVHRFRWSGLKAAMAPGP
jgi:hypothetical protein